jgi:hypothetical protein
MTSTEARPEMESARDLLGKIMAPWTFNVKFPCDTQFIFCSLTFTVGEDGDLKILPLGPAPKRITPTHGQDPSSSATSFASGGTCSDLDPFAGLYICTAKIIQGIPVVTSILRPLSGDSSSSSSAASPEPNSSDDYLKIGVGTYGDSVMESHLICMVPPNEDPSHNSSSRYPAIERSEVSDA